MRGPDGEPWTLQTFIEGAETTAVWSAIGYAKLPSDSRLDSEYYQPEYLKLDDLLVGKTMKQWGELKGNFIVGPFGSSFTVDNYVENSPYRYVRGKDVKPFFLRDDDNAYMPKNDFERLDRYALQAGDLLISVVGTLGNVSIVEDDIGRAIFSCKSTAYRSLDIDPYYLCTYLNSRIGQAYLGRKPRGALQTGLNLDDLKTIPIYLPSHDLQNVIGDLVRASRSKWKESDTLYTQAETLLMTELGLDTLDLTPQRTYVQTASQAWTANRLDAEYFQPKYFRVLGALKSLRPVAVEPLEHLLTTLTNGHTPLHHDLSEGDIPFLTAEHIYDFRIDFDSDKRILAEHHMDELARTQLHDGDMLVTIKGRVGNVAVVERLPGPTNINQDVALFRLKKGYHPYYIAGFLNSPAGKALIEQWSTGQINPFLSLTNLKQVPIPIFDGARMNAVGKAIQQKVEAAYQARQEAAHLLEEAKRRVEAFILGAEV